ncbi:hypothetical protein [Natronorubrum daqingense]|uniref:Uncharacterized protein n=1 Tax=Natronorubrum daqingense TaxID=588898 RepID=A0A1N7AQG7_9EURY|nr:hypothetical protein [Natronorubrum daqingense]SIR41238.1 hypothetical protein SAMN05421809_1256 [Natronorubrum daqingense]
MNRRKVLSAVATTGMLSAVPATASSNEDGLIDKIKTANEVRKETGSFNAWKEYLKDKGLVVSSDSSKLVHPNDEEEVGIQQIDEDGIDMEINLVQQCDEELHYVEVAWEYDWEWLNIDDCESPIGQFGEPPNDYIGFELESYTLMDSSPTLTTDSSEYVEVDTNETEPLSGVLFEVADHSWTVDYQEDCINGDPMPDNLHHAGVYLNTNDDHNDQSHEIAAAYTHHWRDITIESVDFAYPPSSGISVSNESYQIDYQTEDGGDGDFLLVNAEDDTEDGCP